MTVLSKKEMAERQAIAKEYVANGQQVEFVPPPPDIPQEKMVEMQTYARKLMVKHPDWKLSRVQRKTAEHFNIKFTDEKTSAANTAGQA